MTHFFCFTARRRDATRTGDIVMSLQRQKPSPRMGSRRAVEYRREAGVWHGGCTASFRKEAAAADTTTPENKSWIIMFAVLNSKHGLVSDSTPNTRKYKRRQYENHSEIVG